MQRVVVYIPVLPVLVFGALAAAVLAVSVISPPGVTGELRSAALAIAVAGVGVPVVVSTLGPSLFKR